MPSHLDLSGYVTAAFDNFDHNKATTSGLNSTHDTLIDLFQYYTQRSEKRKPNISELQVDKRGRSFANILKCQEVLDFSQKLKKFRHLNFEIGN